MKRREHIADAQAAGRKARRRPLAVRLRIVAGFATACRRAGWAILPLALAALMAAPMPGSPQVSGDCDGNCPRFASTASLTFRISEGTGSGEAIAVLPAATDADQDDYRIVYDLWDRDDPIVNGSRDETGFGDGDAAAFRLDAETAAENGELKTILTLKTRVGQDYDYESDPPKRSYRFRLVACDDEFNRAYVDITVHIDNVNEELGRPAAPMVAGVSTSKLVARWTAPSNTGPPITDYDLRYRKNGTTDAWRSWPHSGTQTNAVITGLEAGTEYEAQVLARNGEGVSAWSPSGTGSTLTAGDNPPVFLDASPTARSVPENTPAGRNVGRPVRAEGESTLTYSLGGADAAAFDIVASSGQVRTKAGVTYDYEAQPSYSVTVTAADQNPNSLDTTISVAISLEDVDEPPLRPAAPVVSTSRGSDTTLDVTWSAPDSTGRPAAEDYDLRYRRIAGAGQNCRSWCAWGHTGSATTTAIVGLESGTQYEVQVLARSHEGASPWSLSGRGWTNTQGNTIPAFDDGTSTTRSVPENTAGNQPVGAPVAAMDGDAGDTVTYLLEGVDAGSFRIDSETGQIRTRTGVTYDYEAKNIYSVVVKATDSSQVGASIAVTIHIGDVDEPPNAPARPTVRGHSTRSLSVSWRAPTNEGRPEIASYDLQYREGTSGDWLDGPQDVTGTSAVIQDATPALEPGTQYQVQVRATNDEGDGGWSQPGSGRTLAPPTFPAGPLTRSFRETTGEGEPAGRNIGAPVRATFSGDTLTYTLEGTDGGSFDIDESGQIRTRAGLTYDYEAEGPDHSYDVSVRASDASGTSVTVEVTIHITDASERPLAPGTPVVDSATTSSLAVRWTAPENTGRPVIETYDLQYRKGSSGGWRNGPQDVTGTSATIADLEPETPYQIQVRASNADGDGPWSPPGAGWTSGDTPGSNSPPTFPAGPLTRSFPENTPPNRPIGEPVTATDTDDGDTLSYSLHGTDAPSFNIDFSTGQLRTKSGAAYESGDAYSVTVRVTDSSNAAASIVVNITVTDADESLRPRRGGNGAGPPPNSAPVFTESAKLASIPVSRSFPENTPPGENVGVPVTATDADNDPLTYSLEGADAAAFDVDPQSGQIRTRAGVTYDHETKPTYAVVVKARDAEGGSGTIVVTILVTDVDEPPATPAAPTVSAPDGSTSSLLVSWTAPDIQSGPPLTDYDVQYRQGDGGDWSDWPHDGTGASATITGLDPGTDHRVRVRARNDEGDSGWSPPGGGRTNSSVPVFAGADATRSFPENMPPGRPIGAPVTATDPDGDTLAYSLAGTDAAAFDIDRETGQIRTRAGVTYDHETRSAYSVIVKAQDDDGSSTVAVTLVVTDVDEMPATPEAPTVRAPDGSTTSLLVTWTAPDLNGGPPLIGYDVAYRKGTSGEWRAWPHDGIRTTTVVAGLLPHTDYQVRVRALNGELPSDWSPPGSGRTNNTAPTFAGASDSRSFPENTPPGEAVGAPITATDPDGDTLRYTLGGTDAASFDIDAESGQIRTRAGVTYDYETQDFYIVTVTASDSSDGRSIVVVTIRVTDVDEKPATPEAPTVRAPEGSSTSLLASWTGPARDGGPPLTDYDVQYRQGAGGDWIDREHRGTATTTTITELRPHTDYQVRVRAFNGELHSDWSPPGGGRTNNTVPTTASATATRSFPENTPSGVNIGAPVTAMDADGDTLTYSLEGADAASFEIDPGNGHLKTKTGVSYDYETNASYSVMVRGSDLLDASVAIGVTVLVTDVDEQPATPKAPTVRALEGSSTSLSASWTAPDLQGGPPLTDYDVAYRQAAGGDWSGWEHYGTATATTITGLSPHTDYQVRVRAFNGELHSDWSPPGSGRTNNTTPTFAGASDSRSFPENTPPGEVVGAPVRATDPDGDTLTYTLGGTDAGSFDIASESGQIKTKAGVGYDHEVQPSYTVTVQAADPLGASSRIAVAIHVTDVAEAPATPEAPTVQAPEGSSTRLLVNWTAPALQGGPPLTDYDVAYRQVAGGDWTGWEHHGIATTTTITQLSPHADYQVRVRAYNDEAWSDWSLPGSGRTNNTAPTFAGATDSRGLPENTPPGEAIGAPVTATDPDGDALTYTLGGTDAGSFDIESESGQIKTRAGVRYDHEMKASYTVTVQAADPLGASSRIAVTIHVTDVAEAPATPEAPSVRAPDGSSTRLLVNWTAPALQGGPPLTDYDVAYRQVVGGDWTGWKHHGTATTTTITQLRPHADYQVRVRAFNDEAWSDWSPPGSGRTNNSTPTFAGATDSRGFPENTPPGEAVGAPVTATDADGDPLTYTLGGPDAGSFDIASESGQIRTGAGVIYDYEVKASYAVTVQATDPLGASSTIAVTIHVTDVAEPPATPDAPTVQAPDGSSTRLLANWTAPDLGGGPPLTDYDVQYRELAGGDWADWEHDGIATTATVTGLEAGTGYQVRVRALNDEAASGWSPPGSGRTNATANVWLARFGRSIARQMMGSVKDRLASPCRTGLQGTLAGHGFGGDRHLTPHSTTYRLTARDGSRDMLAVGADGDSETEGGLVSGMGRTLLAGTEFELGGKTAGSGAACVWGRGAYSSFHERDGSVSLDGNVSTGTLGADYARGPWTVGLALSHSRGRGESGKDDMKAALTGLYPYAGYRVTERFSAWGLGGVGRGGLTVTPESGTPAQADLGLFMAAAGARSLLVAAASGVNIAFETDGFWVRTASDAARGLLASQADASGLRLGLESSYRLALKNGGRLTPKFEIGLRYDGGDAQNGLGMDMGAGLLWSTPLPDVSAEIVVRRVLAHEAPGFNDWSVSGLVRYDPRPSGQRGLSASLTSSIGRPSLDGASGLLERETVAGLASSDTSHGGQLTAEAAYGFPILRGRFTGTPWVRAELLENGRGYRVGCRISPAGQLGSHIGIEGMRRENDDGDAVAEHAIGLRIALGW